jgi:uncharacterized membrane protein YdjX (TVP38/TMEM64 family)
MSKILIALGLLTTVVVLGVFLPVKDIFLTFLEQVRALGVWGPVLLGIVYIAATVLMLPGAILSLGAGFLFGVVPGVITISIASTMGAGAAFLVGRFLARDWVAKKVAAMPKFAALDAAVAREGFKIVFLTRLSPVFPFNLLNYAYGLTGVPFSHFFLASWIGMIPGTILYVYLGSAAQSLAAAAAGDVPRSPAEQIFFWVGLGLALVVVVFVTKVARKALQNSAGVKA